MTVLVGSFPAALSDGEPYIPLQIAVGLRGKGPRVIVTAESFHLIDQDANVYPMASWQEILEQDRAFLFTPQILEAYPLVTGQQFTNSFQLPASFESIFTEARRASMAASTRRSAYRANPSSWWTAATPSVTSASF